MTTEADSQTTAADDTTTEAEGTTATEQAATGAQDTTDTTAEDTKAEVPETYEAFTLPEGFTLEGEDLDDAHALFKELGLPQEAAQKVIDKYIGKIDTLQKSIADAQQAAIEQQREEWGAQAAKEFGKDYQATVERCGVFLKQLSAERPSLLETFNQTGHGNHPDYIWLVAKCAELATTGSHVDGVGGETADAQQMSEGDRAYMYAEKPQRRNG